MMRFGGENPRVTFEQDARSTLRVPRPIDVFQCQTTVGTVFTARADADFQITSLVASNVTGTADPVTIYLVPDGGTAGATNLIIAGLSVAANSTVTIFDENNRGLLQPGMTLEALCGTNDAINLFGHGYDYEGIYG